MGQLGGSQVRPARVDPVISQAAALATGRPVTFSTNGTERLARGLASRTYSRWPLKANWTLRMPTTPRARPRRAVASSTAATWSAPRVMGGSTQAESPEWMPASSMCSITPQTSTCP